MHAGLQRVKFPRSIRSQGSWDLPLKLQTAVRSAFPLKVVSGHKQAISELPVSRSEAVLFWALVGGRDCKFRLVPIDNVFKQVGHGTAKIGAELVDDVGARAVAPVIQDLGKSHTVDPRDFSRLLDGDAPGLPKLLLLNLLSALKTEHTILQKNV